MQRGAAEKKVRLVVERLEQEPAGGVSAMKLASFPVVFPKPQLSAGKGGFVRTGVSWAYSINICGTVTEPEGLGQISSSSNNCLLYTSPSPRDRG